MPRDQSHTLEEAFHYLDYPDTSVPTTELPTTDTPTEESELLLADIRRQRQAGVVPPQGGFTPSKPGWVDQRRNYRSAAAFRPRREGLICHVCYGRHHLAAECTLPARDLERVISNYESLTDAERSRVPATMYWKAKAFVAGDPNRVGGIPTTQNVEHSQAGQIRGPPAVAVTAYAPNKSEN